MKKLLTILFVMFLLVVGIGHSGPIMSMYEVDNAAEGISNTGGAFSYYGFTAILDLNQVENDLFDNTESGGHIPDFPIAVIDSIEEMLWIMDNVDFTGAPIREIVGSSWVWTSNYGAIISDSGFLANLSRDYPDLVDVSQYAPGGTSYYVDPYRVRPVGNKKLPATRSFIA